MFVHICAFSQLLLNVLIASGAMNEPVITDTLPLTIECSHWIATMSMMSTPACIAQTDMDVRCFVNQHVLCSNWNKSELKYSL